MISNSAMFMLFVCVSVVVQRALQSVGQRPCAEGKKKGPEVGGDDVKFFLVFNMSLKMKSRASIWTPHLLVVFSHVCVLCVVKREQSTNMPCPCQTR